MSRTSFPLGVLAFACALLIAGRSSATAQSTLEPPAADNRQVISANPFLLMFGIASIEYQRKHTDATTWGASTSIFGFDNARYGNASAFYRYYPVGKALNGFFVGGRGGVHRVSYARDAGVFYGLGVEVGYDWLLGERKNFSVGIGAGVTRLFGGSLDGVSLTVPTVRLVNLGWSF